MRVSFTGTQQGMTERQKQLLVEELREATEFHHGDCVGADAEAHAIALGLGIAVYVHPPKNSSKRSFCKGYTHIYPEREYLNRNHLIVDYTERLLGCPKGMREEQRSGTWATIRYARAIKRPYLVLLPRSLNNG